MGTFAQNNKGAWSFNGVGVAPTARTAPASIPTITSGAGAPSAAETNGSVYFRTDGGTADLAIYVRQGGSWVVMLGAS
tara:strand:+ start:969 stop:1202 length:234 start_codon:yes stop_codon:yes gene_type:complete